MNLFMISSPKVDWSEWSRFITAESLPEGNAYSVEPPSDAEMLVEMCGRLCYMSYGKGRKTTSQYLDNIIKSQHFSVLEHANWTFIITGVSRSLTHELVRHRHLSFSQLSQRYVDHSEVEFIAPPEVTQIEGWGEVVEAVRYFYDRASGELDEMKRKDMRSAVRACLPNATETKIAVTGNARAWREFIQKRNSPHADVEIRTLAKAVLERLFHSAPDLFRDLMPENA